MVFLYLTTHIVQCGQIPNSLLNARLAEVYQTSADINERHLASPRMRDLAGFRQALSQHSRFAADLFQSIRV
jgi:hypothetical protein